MYLTKGNAKQVGMSEEKIKYTEGLMKKLIDQGVTPAFIGCVARNGVIVYHDALSSPDYNEKYPSATTDSIFPLASISKVITSIAAMILVEDGLLSINRPVNWYLPEFSGEGKEQLMVHHLMTHTSGMDDDVIGGHIDKKVNEAGINSNNYILLGMDAPLHSKPGEYMNYCNYGMELLGEIISRLAGTTIHAFCKDRIFDPLGMKDTFFIVPEDAKNRVVQFPEKSKLYGWGNSERAYNSLSAAGGVYSTVKDITILGQMFLNKGIYGDIRILSPVTISEMAYDRIPGITAEYKDEFFLNASWGLGLNIFGNKLDVESGPLKSRMAFGHGGSGRSIFWVDPVYKVTGMAFYIEMEDYFCRPDDLFRNAVMSAICEE